MDVRGIGLERQLRKEVPLGRRGLGGGVLEDERVGGSRAPSRAPDGVTAMSSGNPRPVKCADGDADAGRAWVRRRRGFSRELSRGGLCPYRPPREQRRPCREEGGELAQVER